MIQMGWYAIKINHLINQYIFPQNFIKGKSKVKKNIL